MAPDDKAVDVVSEAHCGLQSDGKHVVCICSSFHVYVKQGEGLNLFFVYSRIFWVFPNIQISTLGFSLKINLKGNFKLNSSFGLRDISSLVFS